jgi:predicted amidophosphoribosyltransferase
MADDRALGRLRSALVATAGGYLHNPVRRELVTCAVCAESAPGCLVCYRCRLNRSQSPARLADATAFLTYAVSGRQSGYVMRGYKARPPIGEHRTIVTLLAVLGLAQHRSCAERLLAAPVTHWAVVPSLPARPGEHPLRPIVAALAPGTELPRAAAGRTPYPRSVDPQHFRAGAALRPGAHVLVIDDTWVGGGHAQSAVLAARQAGAAYVSVLVLARWLSEDYGSNACFLAGLAGRDYDPGLCPWTGAGCPEPGSPPGAAMATG